jgi:peptide chain release factor 2
MSDPHFWDYPEKAQEIIAKANQLKIWIDPLDELKSRFDDIAELYPEVKKSNDEELFVEIIREFKSLLGELEQLEIKRMLSSEMDKNNCYLSINAGAGGTESCDWALMLSRSA